MFPNWIGNAGLLKAAIAQDAGVAFAAPSFDASIAGVRVLEDALEAIAQDFERELYGCRFRQIHERRVDAHCIGFAIEAFSDRTLHGIDERATAVGIATIVFLAQARIDIAHVRSSGSVGSQREKQKISRRDEGRFDALRQKVWRIVLPQGHIGNERAGTFEDGADIDFFEIVQAQFSSHHAGAFNFNGVALAVVKHDRRNAIVLLLRDRSTGGAVLAATEND